MKKQKRLDWMRACVSSVRLCQVERPTREEVSMRRQKHDVDGGNHGCALWNVHIVRGFYAAKKPFFIHQTTNFYATSASKTFLHI